MKQNMVCENDNQDTMTLIHGSTAIEIGQGMSVAELRWSYRDVLNVGPDARPYVDGNLVGDDYVPSPWAWVEFVRDWGRKGAGRPNSVLVELGPQSLVLLARLAVAAEEIANNLKLPHNNQPALTADVGWTATENPHPASPYLTAEEAARYLGISVKSLYGVVERRHLVPLRGPRRAYRFTTEILDEYLRR
jgi:excisionase family DNA binding protein